MKIRVMSDLHIEFRPDWIPPDVECDLTVLAGDIHTSGLGKAWAIRNFRSGIFYVYGNHEFYGSQFGYGPRTRLEVDGVRIFGCTMWTDFNLYSNQDKAMLDAAAKMVDYRLIENGAKPLTPRDVLEAHRLDRAWLVNCLSEPFDGKTVVVTHHGPSRRSVSEKYGEMPLNAAFASDLEFLMLHVDLWIHGHTHTSRDYEVAGCRVICNPMGYPTAFGSQENEEFNPQLVVEV